MTHYRIVVQGTFGSVVAAGRELQRGFYAACFVAAESEHQAMDMALSSMQQDSRVDKLRADWSAAMPVLTIEEATELADDDEFDESPQGFVVYDESASK